ncbi:DUF6168 family protein [uncultured Croceitalea sp.]|uniref:DUF6168 family protein n=1 Tax=uncultured Croceitalea sp. TaxID=1798908 RepID=UPI0033066ECD
MQYQLPIKVITLLFVALSTSFLLHLLLLNFLELPLFENRIILAYVINFILAAAIFYTLFHFKEKLKNAIGFLFMGGSFLKFIVFFLLFYPVYKSDGEMQKIEFATFFAPYAIALILETYFTSKMLNKSGSESK